MKSDIVKRTNSEEYISGHIDGLELGLHIVKRHLTKQSTQQEEDVYVCSECGYNWG